MLQVDQLPRKLQNAIKDEQVNFIVEAKRAGRLAGALGPIVFAFFWLGITLTIAVSMFGPLITGGEVDITINGVPTTITMDNLDALWMPALIIGVFLVIGVTSLIAAPMIALKAREYFVGTRKKLYYLRNNAVMKVSWYQLSSDVAVSGGAEAGDITLHKDSAAQGSIYNFVPNQIKIRGIKNVHQTANQILGLINENRTKVANSAPDAKNIPTIDISPEKLKELGAKVRRIV